MAQNSVAEIRNKLIDIRRFMMERRDYIQRTDPEFTERIAKTFPSFAPNAVLAANQILLTEFERLMPAYYATVAKTYQADKVDKLKKMLNGLDKIPAQ